MFQTPRRFTLEELESMHPRMMARVVGLLPKEDYVATIRLFLAEKPEVDILRAVLTEGINGRLRRRYGRKPTSADK